MKGEGLQKCLYISIRFFIESFVSFSKALLIFQVRAIFLSRLLYSFDAMLDFRG